MAGSLDSCISNIYEPGNIPASAGTPPVRVLNRDPFEVLVSEAAAALDTTDIGFLVFDLTVSETAAAVDETDIELLSREAMLPVVFVNSDGTPRQAYIDGVMVNL